MRDGRRQSVGRLVALAVTTVALGTAPVAPDPTAPAAPAPASAALAAQAQELPAVMQRSAMAAAPVTAATPAADETVIVPPDDLAAAAVAPAEPPPDLLVASDPEPVVPADGLWAVVIGINDYPGRRHDLRYATVDALDVDQALDRYGIAPERRLVLTNGQASAATIRASLDWLVARAGPDATAVFFYAGHVRKLSRTTEAIVAADGELVTDQEVADRLSGLRAPRAWLVLASCYGGGFTEALAPGRILTAAAEADQLAYENSTYGRSYLVEYMVRRAMLEGHADESIEASFRWAVEVMREEHPYRVPVQFDRHDGELRLGTPSGPDPSRTPQPQPPSQQPPEPPAAQEPPGDAQDGDGDHDGGDDGGGGRPQGCLVRVGAIVTCPD